MGRVVPLLGLLLKPLSPPSGGTGIEGGDLVAAAVGVFQKTLLGLLNIWGFRAPNAFQELPLDPPNLDALVSS